MTGLNSDERILKNRAGSFRLLDFNTLFVARDDTGQWRLTVYGEANLSNGNAYIARRFPSLCAFQVVGRVTAATSGESAPFSVSIPLSDRSFSLDGIEVHGATMKAVVPRASEHNPVFIIDEFLDHCADEVPTNVDTELEPLTWAAVGTAIVLGIVGAAAGRAFNQWMDSIQPNRLEHFIRDVVEEFARRVERAIRDDRVRLIMSRARSLHEHFADYLADPTSAPGQRTLDQAEYECVELINDVLHTDLDLQRGHGAFLDLAPLRLAMIQEQMKRNPTRVRLFARAAEQYGNQAYRFYEDWVNWHISQFGEVHYHVNRFAFTEYGQLFLPADRLATEEQVNQIRWDRIINGPHRNRLNAEVIEPANSIMYRLHDLSQYADPKHRVFTLRYRGGGPRDGLYLRANAVGFLELSSIETFWEIEKRPDWGTTSWGDFDKYAIRYHADGQYKGWHLLGTVTSPSDPRPQRSLRLSSRSSAYTAWALEPVWNGRHCIRNANFLGAGAYLYISDAWGVCFGRHPGTSEPPPWEIMEFT